ncbi:uncharacterized protein LOC128233946 isoform X1 [Mya arenaria]|uniref:uncharacterized protein LOC128233946 isoform X1 n=2 Tax=Mya arenaria TaxID=6604 RepID=UPI0022E47F58|nr:uncharacterized protein LOC128233946 isoform X1 [Mya arenaria]
MCCEENKDLHNNVIKDMKLPTVVISGILVSCLYRIREVYAQTDALTPDEIATMQAWGIEVEVHAENNTITIKHHGYPNHTFEGGWGNNPNTVSHQNYSFNIPKHATVSATPACVGQLGPIGLSLSGASFYNPYTGGGNNAVEGDCAETFDDCSGHPSPGGAYHYHQLPSCIYTGNDLRNKFLGVAFDGYPIYGPMDGNANNLTSSDLDDCHGHTDSDGRYKYRATADFPYLLGCYHGEPVMELGNANGNGGNLPPPPNGQRPPSSNGQGPPPAGRKRRSMSNMRYEFVGYDETKNRRVFKRQTMTQTNECLNVEYQNWQSQTCYAFCENPSDGSFDDCPFNSAPVPGYGAKGIGIFVAVLTMLIVPE